MAAEEPDKPANPHRITRARPPAESDAQPPWQPPTSDAHIEDDETGEFLPGTSGATPDGRAAPDDSPLPVATSSSNLPSMLLEAAAAADADERRAVLGAFAARDGGAVLVATRDTDFTLVRRALEEDLGFGVICNARELTPFL